PWLPIGGHAAAGRRTALRVRLFLVATRRLRTKPLNWMTISFKHRVLVNLFVPMVARLFPKLPAYDPTLYRLCQRYVDRYRGENNSDIRTNGELSLLQQVLPGCRVVFDVGANVGSWTALALSINPHIIVHCFEPSRATFSKLLEQGFPGNVICNNFGLGSTMEERVLYVFEEASGLNSLYKRYGLENGWGLLPQESQETVRLDTLDHYCEVKGIEAIDFLKIDVEGHELYVLQGAREMLERGRVKIIQFEYGGCNIDARVLLKDLFEFFNALPYALHKITSRGLQRVERYDQRLENFQYQNWAAIRT
ncbi:MAG: FkbM family methyltransferase, partial [Anaerolineae bacterium]|nr:FkbM family methyltransferase [Anaerolineae bacterium]